MKCPRCALPIDPDDTQCNVCGEILADFRTKTAAAFKTKAETTNDSSVAPDLDFLKYNPDMPKYGIWFMIASAVFAALCLAVAFFNYSIEALYAAFIAGGLIFLPLLVVIFGRSLQAAYVFRKELIIALGIAGGLCAVYFLGKSIEKSQMQIETSGVYEIATNENSTKTFITIIICFSILLALIPITRVIIRGMALGSGNNRLKTDTEREMHTRSSENTTSLELRKLELQHDLELRKLDLEKERLHIEAEQRNLLQDNRTQLITDNRQTHPESTFTPSPPPPPPSAPS